MPTATLAYPTSPAAPNQLHALLALSVVVPIHDEEENIPLLHERLTEVLAQGPARYRDSYEVILVDDGSSDRSFEACAALQARDSRVRVVQFRRNFGKTAALHAGFSLSRGDHIVTIDADMQEDPVDMFRLLERISAGDDLVSAWRQQRNDPLDKTLPSRFFNAVVARMTGVHLHDFNCGFKAYHRDVITDLDLYGEQHRFIPVLANQRGFRVSEVVVQHQPRRFGKSKFGTRRLLNGYLDFLQVLFLVTYLRRPLRLFGMLGTVFSVAGFLICVYLTGLWIFGDRPIGDRPLLILGVLLLITGLQFISTGLVGEMLRRDSYHPNDEYSIRRIVQAENIGEPGV
jgi:glycosyltransferase involved in cell wall biosynthesis